MTFFNEILVVKLNNMNGFMRNGNTGYRIITVR